MEAAVAALDAGSYDLAITLALGTAALLKALPDHKHGDTELTWSQEGIDTWVQEVHTLKAAATVRSAGGVVRVPVRYHPTRGGCHD